MVDLVGQYHRLKKEIDEAISSVLERGSFINGPEVNTFGSHLASYLNVRHVIPCGNGTDALQIALMRLNLQRGDEVIVPAFTYAAAAEAAVLLGLVPVLVDVDERTFNIDPKAVEAAITERTRAIIPIHLFGQSCEMSPIMELARERGLYVIEDNAQSLGAEYIFPDGTRARTGTMGDIGTLSFFPTKILGAYGDGGALLTRDSRLAEALRQTTIHGQNGKYHHQMIGCNSRLDTLQAAILDVKLKHVGEAIQARQKTAEVYDAGLSGIEGLAIPYRAPYSTHVFHQYTVRIADGRRDALRAYLKELGIPTMVYYPIPMQEQEAFKGHVRPGGDLSVSKRLTESVLSLPIHTEMTPEIQYDVIEKTIRYFR